MPRTATTCAGFMLESRPTGWIDLRLRKLACHKGFHPPPATSAVRGSAAVQGLRRPRSLVARGPGVTRAASWSEHRRATSSSSQRIGQVRNTRYWGLHWRIQHVGWRVGGAGPWAAAMPIGDRLCHRCNSSTVRLGGSVASPAVAGGRIRERGAIRAHQARVETPGTPDMMRPRLSPCTAAAMQSYCVGGRNVQS